MYADAVRATHNGTGGASTLTLASVSGWPQPSSVWGSTLTGKLVYYEICEFTDSTFATLNQYERGIGSLNLSTGILTRTPQVTYTGGAYTTSSASAISVTNTAANVQILFTASAVTQRPALPAVQSSYGNGLCLLSTRATTAGSTAGSFTMVAGTRYYAPVEVAYANAITKIGVIVNTAASSSSLRVSIYDFGANGLPGNLITEFTSLSQISVAATGVVTLSVTSTYIPPGWYYMMVQSNGAPVLSAAPVMGDAGMGMSGARQNTYFSLASTYGAAPSVGDTAGLTAVNGGTGSISTIYIS